MTLEERIQKLEAKIEALETENKIQTGTITSDYFDFTQTNGRQRLQKRNGVVSFYISATCIQEVKSWNTDTPWFVFPDGFRPSEYNLFVVATGNQSTTNLQNKTILVGILSDSGKINGQQTFAVGDAIQISGTFLAK